MSNLIVELNQEEKQAIYGGVKYAWIEIKGVMTRIIINE